MRREIAIIFAILSITLVAVVIYQNTRTIKVTGFVLINSETNEPISEYNPIQDGSLLNFTSLQTQSINIQALTEPKEVGSVVFFLNNSFHRIENKPPYTVAGENSEGNFTTWHTVPGLYNLTAFPYSEEDGKGKVGNQLSITFKIEKSKYLLGQIVVDPDNPSWLIRYKGDPFFLCGPGDPEDFLYRGTRNPDGTRDGDQLDLINKLIGTGANSIYLQSIRSHGGDGEPDHNPFIDSDPQKGLDKDILDQWDQWFSLMDENDILIYFFFYDDGSIVWDTGDEVFDKEREYIKEIVNRFQHYKNLIWVVTEEFQGVYPFDNPHYSVERISKIAEEIRYFDTYDHVIAVHHSAEEEMAFPDDPNIDQYAIQYYNPYGRDEYTRTELHEKIVKEWEVANNRYNLNMAESDNWGSGEKARKKSWAVAMGGAYVMVLWMDIASTPISDLEDCGRLVHFMEMTDFNTMSPKDELAYQGTEYVLASPGNSYIAYASALNGNIGIKNMNEGYYDLLWFDIPTGLTVFQESMYIRGGDKSWVKPEEIGNELALYVKINENEPISVFPGSSWEYRSPETFGMDSHKLQKVADLVGGSGLIVKNGFVVKTWGDQNYVHYWASSSKPVLSTMLLFAVHEGKLESVDSLVNEWGWNLSTKDKTMTFRHLANMVSGYARPEAPGEAYAYNDRAIQLYYLTLERVFGTSINEAAMNRLHSQLQLEGSKIFSETGHVLLSPPDFARISWFWLNKGNWDGNQILPEHYFEDYLKSGVPINIPYAPFDHYANDYLRIGTYGADDTSRSNSPGVGIYGFNWWFNSPGILMDGTNFELTWPDAPEDTFMSLGLGDANSLIIPSRGIVVVTAESNWGPTVEMYSTERSANKVIKTLLDSFIE